VRLAVLVDAAFFIRRYYALVPGGKEHSGPRVAEALHTWACKHLADDGAGHVMPRGGHADLYRIFVYDCPPYDGGLHTPIKKEWVNFKKTPLYTFRTEFHERLKQLRKVALRLGHLGEVKSWALKPDVQQALLKQEREVASLTDDDVTLETKQKGVDMRIGVDVASLAFKRQVDRIVLVAGDADFVPAAKLARREGLDFVLDSMHAPIARNLYEHIDGLTSMAPRPANHQDKKHPPKDFTASYNGQYNLSTKVSFVLRPAAEGSNKTATSGPDRREDGTDGSMPASTPQAQSGTAEP
jgi:uncharacterized LabA/DUF88 family protein